MTNNLKAVVFLNTYKESGYWTKTKTGSKTGIEGVIYKVNPKKNTPVKFGKSQDLPQEMKHVKDIEEKLCNVSGSFLESIIFNEKSYWNIEGDKPER